MPLTLHNLAHPLRIDHTGTVRIGPTRVTLETVIRTFLQGATPEDIADAYSLDLATTYATISYYLQNRQEVDAYLGDCEATEATVAQMIAKRSAPAALRAKLLARQTATAQVG